MAIHNLIVGATVLFALSYGCRVEAQVDAELDAQLPPNGLFTDPERRGT